MSRSMHFGRYDYASFLVFFAYASGSAVVPVALVALARDLGFSLETGGMTAGGALQLGRTLAVVASLGLCGFAAGRWGTRPALGTSMLLVSLGMLGTACAPAYGVLVAALMVAGVGEGIVEGLGTPYVQDLHPAEPGRYTNFAHAFWSVGILVTVLVSAALLTIGVSWRWLAAGVAGLACLGGILVLAPPRSGQVYPDAASPSHWRDIGGHAAAILRRAAFWRYFAAMFLAGGGEFCLTFWTASHIQLRFGATAWRGGLGMACFAGGMVLGRIGWGYLIGQHQLKALIVASAGAGTVVCLALPSAPTAGAFLCLLVLAGLATAPFWPSIQSHATHRLPDLDSTMLLILLSCAGVPGCGLFAWLMGLIGDSAGELTNAFFLVPACYAGLGLLVGCEPPATGRRRSRGRLVRLLKRDRTDAPPEG